MAITKGGGTYDFNLQPQYARHVNVMQLDSDGDGTCTMHTNRK